MGQVRPPLSVSVCVGWWVGGWVCAHVLGCVRERMPHVRGCTVFVIVVVKAESFVFIFLYILKMYTLGERWQSQE